MFKLALIQMIVRAGRKQENLSHAEELVRRAAADGAEVVLLPEALTLGWTDPSAKTEADKIPEGESCARLRKMAREAGVYVCAGLIERAGSEVFNAAVFIDPTGNVLLHHRKINELEIGHPVYALGDRLQVSRTSLGTIGLMICADGFAHGQVVSRTLGYMGADVILSPCAWAVPADHDDVKNPYGKIWLDNYGPVAKDFHVWIAGASNVGWIESGPWKGRKCIGCSLVIGPAGAPVLRGPYGVDAEAILHFEITPERRAAQGDGWARVWRSEPEDRQPC
ncbi:MAG: carbon-nitrogen hydrolase family protein [Verrucomicrobia bacterium]|nr:carbon-nitrogen hydrolase family protein [Verrucomicrobiota bacterium]